MTRVYCWRRIDVDDGLGIARLTQGENQVTAEATEILCNTSIPLVCRFRVNLGPDWVTQRALIEVTDEKGTRSREVVRDYSGRWTIDGAPVETPTNCFDVDVAATPFTNTFPLRRMGLASGESQDIVVVWIGVPELEVEIVSQRYERVDDAGGLSHYAYVETGSGSRYGLSTDDECVVIDYERFATRLAPRSY